MAKKSKSRKAKVFYTLQDAYGKDVNIDLNNYNVVCTKTGKPKSFYHKYLYNLIQRKYEGNIDRFRTEYVSREAAPSGNERKAQQINDRIQRLMSTIADLEVKRDDLLAATE